MIKSFKFYSTLFDHSKDLVDKINDLRPKRIDPYERRTYNIEESFIKTLFYCTRYEIEQDIWFLSIMGFVFICNYVTYFEVNEINAFLFIFSVSLWFRLIIGTMKTEMINSLIKSCKKDVLYDQGQVL